MSQCLCEKPSGLPSKLGIIAGKGCYPLLLAQSARKQGVPWLLAVAFKGETDPAIRRYVDEVEWIHLGQLQPFLDAFRKHGVTEAVMAGQITPSNLFTLRFDAALLALLKSLSERNAHTLFGAIGGELQKAGVALRPAHLFMEEHLAAVGKLTARGPTPEEQVDIEFGLRIARATSGLEIGQTVVVKRGTVLAVEAFEGTDAAIRRAGKVGGAGGVVIKAAKPGHDMRFDIPVVGLHTLKSLRKARATCLAMEAGRCIVLEREKVAAEADRLGLCLVAVGA